MPFNNEDDLASFRYVAAHLFAATAPNPPDRFRPAPVHDLGGLRRNAFQLIPVDVAASLTDAEAKTLQQWLSDGTYDIDERLQAIGAAAHEAYRLQELEHERRRFENDLARLVSWRWHFAAKMLSSMPEELAE